MNFNALWAYEKAFAVVEITQGAYSLDYALDLMPLAQVFAILDYYAIYKGDKTARPDPVEAREKSIRLRVFSEMMEKKKLEKS